MQLGNTTMQELFGLWANKVTVGNLIFMQSGINDYEIGSFDDDLLKPENSHRVQDPMGVFNYVANLAEPSPCEHYNCTWIFEPGTHTQYSSTNFILAGFVLLAHAPEG
jgi:CubicO group peptidase (beta-lactamase class C family)